VYIFAKPIQSEEMGQASVDPWEIVVEVVQVPLSVLDLLVVQAIQEPIFGRALYIWNNMCFIFIYT
jgi:hypothetical protein